MFQEFLARSDLLVFPILGFLIFFVTFVAVLVSVLRKGRDHRTLQRLAALPLDDDSTSPAPADRASRLGTPATSGGE